MKNKLFFVKNIISFGICMGGHGMCRSRLICLGCTPVEIDFHIQIRCGCWCSRNSSHPLCVCIGHKGKCTKSTV